MTIGNTVKHLGIATGLLLSNVAQALPIEEHCFTITSEVGMAIRPVNTTPEVFVRTDPNILAAINGPYYDKDDKTEGLAFLANDYQFATGLPKDIRGYFSVNRTGDTIRVTETLENIADNFLAIGTHPLLVVNGEIHNQAQEERYTERLAYRSAIGTKDKKNICFIVSTDKIIMEDWAKVLKVAGYQGALNLDGGPVSQMAIRYPASVGVKGYGTDPTKLVIFSYQK